MTIHIMYGKMKSRMSVGKSIFAVNPHIRIVEVNTQTSIMMMIESFLKVSRANCSMGIPWLEGGTASYPRNHHRDSL
jgi:hypothetical protein